MNTFGKIFKVTTWGESHGSTIGLVIDGVPSNIELSEQDIQPFLDLRKPGGSFTSQRQEDDLVSILSGLYEGKTTGAPISLQIKNTDARPSDYEHKVGIFRPNHADYTYYHKYGIYDWYGGGRASARETACRVAAGAVARKIIPHTIKIESTLIRLGEKFCPSHLIDYAYAKTNPLRCPNPSLLSEWEDYISSIRKSGDSVGGIVELNISGVEIGIGEPVYHKLDAKLAEAMMSIPAVKGVEIGDGFALAAQKGSDVLDTITPQGFLSNHMGGILGGISTGQDIILRIAFKPTSTIFKEISTTNTQGQTVTLQNKGRHDPCVAIRGAQVIEAMAVCVLADLHLLQTRKRTT